MAGESTRVKGMISNPSLLYYEVLECQELLIEDNYFTAVEHASAPSFKSKSEGSEDPTSTGKDFQPASWKP